MLGISAYPASFYTPLSPAVYDIDSSPKSFKTIGYKYLQKKYEGV